MPESAFNDLGCAKLLQAVIYSALEAVERPQNLAAKDSIPLDRRTDYEYMFRVEARNRKQMAEVVRKGIEFALREPNRFLDFYEELFGVDVLEVRRRLIERGNDQLIELGYAPIKQTTVRL
jgi:hypothetical protein